MEEAIDGRLELVLSEPVMGELRRILAEKIGFAEERVREVAELLDDLAAESVGGPVGEPEAVSGDPDDDLILATAVEAGVDVLVSGDTRHMLPLGEHHGVRILRPQALLAELREA